MMEFESFSYSDCGYTMTAIAAAVIEGNSFIGNLLTYTFDPAGTGLLVTFDYPAVSVASLTSGEIVTFVSPVKIPLSSGAPSNRHLRRANNFKVSRLQVQLSQSL
jgi:hypothetical protein